MRIEAAAGAAELYPSLNLILFFVLLPIFLVLLLLLILLFGFIFFPILLLLLDLLQISFVCLIRIDPAWWFAWFAWAGLIRLEWFARFVCGFEGTPDFPEHDWISCLGNLGYPKSPCGGKIERQGNAVYTGIPIKKTTTLNQIGSALHLRRMSWLTWKTVTLTQQFSSPCIFPLNSFQTQDCHCLWNKGSLVNYDPSIHSRLWCQVTWIWNIVFVCWFVLTNEQI